MSPLQAQWLFAFLVTLAVELPLFVLLTRGRAPWRRAVWAGLICSGLTHPLLWFGWSRVVADYGMFIVSGELLVVALEAALLQLLARPGWRLALSTALLANGASFAVGWLLH